MSAYDEILGSLPLDQIAAQVGAQPQEVEQASAAILPALLGGLQANASDGGAGSLLQALGQHDPALLDGGVDLGQVDPQDGAAIASHIFGGNEDEIVSRLGASPAAGSLGSGLVKKLIPILAPIVLSWLAKQILGKAGGGATQSSSGGGGLGDILGSILGGGQSAPTEPAGQSDPTGQSPGSLEDMLKDVLGGAVSGAGQAAPQQTQSAPAGGGSIIDILGGLLGGGRR